MQPGSIAPIVAVIVRKQKDIVAAFERAAATSAERAVSFDSIGVQEGMALRKLREHAVVCAGNNGHFYLDQANWMRLCHRRRRMAMIVSLCGLAIVAAIWIFGAASR